jgi:hypothetical protein
LYPEKTLQLSPGYIKTGRNIFRVLKGVVINGTKEAFKMHRINRIDASAYLFRNPFRNGYMLSHGGIFNLFEGLAHQYKVISVAYVSP